MSRSNNCAALALALAAMATAPAQAQDSPTAASIKALQGKDATAADAKGKASVQPKDASVSTSVPRAGKRPLMRCWQEGKLVYEGAGMVMSSQQGASYIDLRNGNSLALQIFDLKNGLCLLDHAAE